MALQTKKLTGTGSHNYHNFTLELIENSTDTTANTSSISWSFKLSPKQIGYDWRYWGNTVTYSVNINGTIYTGSIPDYDGKSTVTLVSKDNVLITHDQNGKKNIECSFSVKCTNSTYYLSGDVSVYGVMELTYIPRAATIDEAPNFTDTENPTIKYIAGNVVERLEACIKNEEGTLELVPYKDITDISSGTYTYLLTEANINALLDAATANTIKVRFMIRSTIDGEKYVDSAVRDFTVTDAMPTLKPTVKDVQFATTYLTGNENVMIPKYSIIEYAFNAAAKKRATIKSYSVVCGSKSGNAATGEISKPDNNLFKFTITDSRGNTVNDQIEMEYIPYVDLTITQKASIELVDETEARINITLTGNYYNGSFGVVDNDIGFKYRYKTDDSDYTDWYELEGTPTISNNTYTFNSSINGLDYLKTYTVQCRVWDMPDIRISDEYTLNLTPVFYWGKNEFTFNVPVTIQGNTINDFVVETGTEPMGSNGTWYWCKWKSGLIECWGKRNFGNVGFSTSYGSLYRSETFTQSLPYIFSNTPEYISIEPMSGSGGTWVLRGLDTSASKNVVGGFALCRPNNTSLSQVYLGFYVRGR